MADNIIPMTPPAPMATVTITVELPVEVVALLNKFCAFNQHTANTHGPLSFERLAQMWLEDVAAAVKDNTTWQGAHATLILSEHGYRT
jgi:hypothetical protein